MTTALTIKEIEKISEVRKYLDDPQTLVEFEQRISKVEHFLKRFGNIEQLTERLEYYGNKIYTSKEFLTVDEAALFLGLSKSQIYKLTSARKIAAYKPNGKALYLKMSDLNEWIASGRLQSSREIEMDADWLADRYMTINSKR